MRHFSKPGMVGNRTISNTQKTQDGLQQTDPAIATSHVVEKAIMPNAATPP